MLDVETLCSELKSVISKIEDAEKMIPAERFRMTLQHLARAKKRLNDIIEEAKKKGER